MNFLTLSYTFLPYLRATIMDEKLSSKRMISQAPLATSVPVIPIANPTSALVKAGASLVPSPVTATTPFESYIPVTSKYLSSGDDLAKTLKCYLISSNFFILTTASIFSLGFLGCGTYLSPSTAVLKSFPVMHAYSWAH